MEAGTTLRKGARAVAPLELDPVCDLLDVLVSATGEIGDDDFFLLHPRGPFDHGCDGV